MNWINHLTYKANIELRFDYGSNIEVIMPEYISSIMVHSDYDNNVLPVVYISLAVNASQYQNIFNYKSSAKFYLNIQVFNSNIATSIKKTIIDGYFGYIPSNLNPNYTNSLNTSDQTIDNSYRRIMLGLVSLDLSNALRKSFNGIYYNIDQTTLIGLALEGTKAVIERPLYNASFDSIIVPPLSTRYRMLEYIFKRSAFYNTNFRYFMDFEKSYLVSKEGNPVSDNSGNPSTILIAMKDISMAESYYDGIEIKNDAYYAYINPMNANFNYNIGTDKIANKIVAVNADRGTQMFGLDINNDPASETKLAFARSKNGAVDKNEIEGNNTTIDILKQHIDPSIFTPNKEINVLDHGNFIMSYKREFYKGIAGEFIISCNVGLRSVNKTQAYRDDTEYETNPAVSTSSRKSTTSSIVNTTRKAQR